MVEPKDNRTIYIFPTFHVKRWKISRNGVDQGWSICTICTNTLGRSVGRARSMLIYVISATLPFLDKRRTDDSRLRVQDLCIRSQNSFQNLHRFWIFLFETFVGVFLAPQKKKLLATVAICDGFTKTVANSDGLSQ